MSVSIDLLLAISARSPRAADALLRRGTFTPDADTAEYVCWVQTVLSADATAAQIALAEAVNAAESTKAKSARVLGGPGWARAVEVDDRRTEGAHLLLTRYLFKAT